MLCIHLYLTALTMSSLHVCMCVCVEYAQILRYGLIMHFLREDYCSSHFGVIQPGISFFY